MIFSFFFGSLSEIFSCQRFQQSLSLLPSPLFCTNCDFCHHLFPPNDIKTYHHKVTVSLETPALLAIQYIYKRRYLDEFFSSNSIHFCNFMGRWRLASICFPVPQGNRVGKADVK